MAKNDVKVWLKNGCPGSAAHDQGCYPGGWQHQGNPATGVG